MGLINRAQALYDLRRILEDSTRGTASQYIDLDGVNAAIDFYESQSSNWVTVYKPLQAKDVGSANDGMLASI